jgi:hypothetical protein
MINTKRLRDRQAAMFRKHHRVRPYSHARRDQAEEHKLRLRKMFSLGLSDEFISGVLGVGVQVVRFLRDVQL